MATKTRVLATVLFTDIVRSTEIASELGDVDGASSCDGITPSCGGS